MIDPNAKYKKWAIRVAAVFIALMMVTGGCTMINKILEIDDDNPVEELAEEIIKAQTGIDIDLTPESEE